MSTALGKAVPMCQWWLELALVGGDCNGGGGDNCPHDGAGDVTSQHFSQCGRSC
jgi:hypothetical protein